MKNKFLLIILLSIFFFKGNALLNIGNTQRDIYNFAENCVILPEYEELYGFVMGASPDNKDAYFILIKKDKKFEETVKASFNKDKQRHTATLIDGDINIGFFYIGLYKVEGRPTIQKKYFRSIADYKGKYSLLTDGNRTYEKKKDAWTRKIMDLYINTNFNVRRMRDKNDYRYEQLNFECSHPGRFALSGLPIIDDNGNVGGIVAQTQRDNNESSMYVIDIIAIRQKLMEAASQDECKYFNLVEAGAANDETYCEFNKRMKKEDAKRREYAENLRIQQLKQEDKKLIDEKVKKFGKSSLERVQKRIYNRNIDRPIAISALGNGALGFIKMKSSDNQSSGNLNNNQSYSYFLGMGIHLNPDRGRVRFTLKPGYGEYGFKIESGYSYSTTASQFALKKLRIKSYEISAMTEIVTKRTEKENSYFGFGYGYGRTQSVTFGYDAKTGADRRETVMGNPKYYHKILAELGLEYTKFRFALFASYQFGRITNKNYELILSGESIYPFRDMPKGFFVIGLEGGIRLWSQWRNDYKTMF